MTVKSIRSLAPLVGRSESTVRKWLRDGRWPFARVAPWPRSDVAKMKLWAQMYLSHDQAHDYHEKVRSLEPGQERPPTKMEQAKLAYMVERAQWVRQKRLADAGELHSRKDCEQRRLRQIHEVKGRLLELARSMANTLAMQRAEEVERLLTEQVLSILDLFAGDANGQ